MKYKLEIPKPCHADWNSMSATNQGKFCASCKKEVINFELYTNAQILSEISNNTSVCGRLSKNQINSEFTNSKPTPTPFWGVLFSFTSLLTAIPVLAQKEKAKIEIIESKSSSSTVEQTDSTFVTVSGIVLEKLTADAKKSIPLPGAVIEHKQSKTSVTTDFNGKFTVKIPFQDFSKSKLLLVHFIGMESKEIEVLKAANNLKIELTPSEMLLGEVIIVRKRNIFDRIRSIFR
ncbi:carboxypeptidase-like regulatory domain-containing protein [Flavobacterium sp. CHNK8]|uniref:carboxypeptidase-like regulatory domain-containing protein n=1 Tax=Flavobacterium sp. CHNK8 TaxID=2871165 RepID=UPI001C8D7EAC|nr:carboxypeptidase-like regulatory domain-containing protein [Flavobacterium sp. CHNK8]QZK89698.1 carboxypeptidase-like regulatory domain-containing protein [Flavobacterium sp. CHNK8]